MLSVLRVATPAALGLSPSPRQLTAQPPVGKRATFAVVIADASDSPAAQDTQPDLPLPVAICHLKPLTTGTQRFLSLARPLPAPDVASDTGKNGASRPHASCDFVIDDAPAAYISSSCFDVQGPFDLLYCVQKGGFASAWAAKDQSTGRILCLKAFQSLRDPDVLRSVKTELRMFRRMVKSKGGENGKQFIIELSRSIQHDSTVFFAMELMTTDLGMYLSTEPEKCKLHARRWMAQIALGIDALHGMGILHRDIKSENILIDSRENVRIIDFGLSYMSPTGKPLRREGEYAVDFQGTLPYMSPEMLGNKEVSYHQRKRYGVAVDWWALGCILFELESWDHMLLFDSEEDVHAYVEWIRQSGEVYPKFRGLNPLVVSLLEGLLDVQPSDRYSFEEMEIHAYFLRYNGTSEFDKAAVRALERPIRPELVPQFAGGDKPIKVVEAATLSSVYDWTNVKLANLGGG